MFQSDVLETANVLAGEEWSNGDGSHLRAALSASEDECNQQSGVERAKHSELSFYHIQIYCHGSGNRELVLFLHDKVLHFPIFPRNDLLVINRWISDGNIHLNFEQGHQRSSDKWHHPLSYCQDVRKCINTSSHNCFHKEQ